MDLTSILGILLAFASISVGDILEGGNPLHLVHLSSIIIIVPTTLAAAMSATNSSYVKAAYKELKVVFLGAKVDMNATIKTLVEFATIARRDGVLALESKVLQLEDDFMRESLNMVVDGKDLKTIEAEMEVQIEKQEEYYHGAAHYWILAAESSPTFGLVGAVMGLLLRFKS